jgi:hypothetical protein
MIPESAERPRGQRVKPKTARITAAALAPVGLALILAFVFWDHFVFNLAVAGYHRAAGQAAHPPLKPDLSSLPHVVLE